MSARLPLLAAACVALLGGFVPSSAAFADRALVVGIDSYRDGSISLDLKGAARADAVRMQGLLTGSLGYRPDDVKVLLDDRATAAAILDGLQDWLPQAGPGERVFFYFAGQGHFLKDGATRDDTILPFDAAVERRGGTVTFGNGLRESRIAALLGRLQGRHVTEVIDSSHSGAVTRAIVVEAAGGNPAARSPQLDAQTRSIVVEPQIGQESETPPLPGLDLVKWEAVSPSQVALVDEEAAPAYHGVFTAAFADGIEKGLADANHDGVISNQELLDYVRARSAAYCGRHADRCEMGLTPTLSGDGAALEVAASLAGGTPVGPLNQGRPTAEKILDVLGARLADDVHIQQFPPSPVRLGTRDMHFRVTSSHDGFLVLLSVSDDGEVVQLFPNAIAAAHGKDGRIRAGSPITVPDSSYGIRFDATSVTKGTVLALVAVDPLQLPRSFVTRKIDVIPQDEVNSTVLPELAQSLATPAHADGVEANAKAVGRSVATLRYEIIP